MVAQEMLSRVKTDFFAILIPGSFIMGVIVSVVLVFTQYDTELCIMERFNSFFETLKGNWVLSFIVFIMIFLVGNLLHSIRVNKVDRIANFFFNGLIKEPRDKAHFENPFPYRAMLEEIKTGLLKVKLIEDIPLPEDRDTLHDVFIYWKTVIRMDSPGSFHHIQDLEGRVRMFAGMFWAGVVGILGSIGSIVTLSSFIFNEAAWSVWGGYILFMFIISVIISAAFSLSLKHARSEEVKAVFLTYLYLQKKMREEKREKGKEKGSVLG
ncbi:MAG: hypothetical protein NT166_23485 [Candidatus Aminicenantes bacterium]|nr:hypothetical protein [Candidatus Aminicenantes bacterium]